MKELVGTLNDAIATRIKAPFLGSFILCYISLNLKGIGAFYLGNTIQRKAIIANFEFFSIDFIWAIGLVVVYIVLTQFILPMFQTKIDKWKFKRVTRPYHRLKSIEKRAHHIAMAKANISKYKANEDYIKSKHDKELENWLEEKESLKNQLMKIESESQNKDFEIEQLGRESSDTEQWLNIRLSKSNELLSLLEGLVGSSDEEVMLTFKTMTAEQQQLILDSELKRVKEMLQKFIQKKGVGLLAEQFND